MTRSQIGVPPYLDEDVHEPSETHSRWSVHLEELGHIEEDRAFLAVREFLTLVHFKDIKGRYHTWLRRKMILFRRSTHLVTLRFFSLKMLDSCTSVLLDKLV